ncbi:MAG: hypothetical protein M9894_07795 [Planctomycetes bacterium]|nr:hypothetical protein [Planctomycetota bacterium]
MALAQARGGPVERPARQGAVDGRQVQGRALGPGGRRVAQDLDGPPDQRGGHAGERRRAHRRPVARW